MPLTLRIENHDSLPDGGPLSAVVTEAGLEVGRDSAMGWTLPDPSRFISSRHFEVRHERGAFWLYDTSTNGTYLNGAASRVKSPHRLAGGDRLQVGPYRIVVEEQGHAAAPGADPFAPSAFGGSSGGSSGGGAFGGGGGGGGADIWGVGGAAPAPIPDFDPRPARRLPDFGDQHLEMPRMATAPAPAPGASPFGEARQPAPHDDGAGGSPAASPFGTAPDPAPYGGGAGSGAAASPFGNAPAAGFSPGPAAPAASPFDSTAPAALDPRAAPNVEASPFAPAGTAGGGAAARAPMPAMPAAAEGFRPVAPTTPPAAHVAPQPTASAGGADARALVEAICAGAGLPPGSLSVTDPAMLGTEIGQMLRLATEELAALLRARAATKQSVRAGQRTMIGATDNNPLKFMPSPEEALDAMLGRPRPGFLRGAAALREGFADVKQHQYATHAALQPALARLLEDLAPEAIEAKTGGSLMSSRKARAWELFVERWDAKTHPYENGMLDVFLTYYAEAYEQATKKRGA